MANQEQLNLINRGAKAWNEWREKNPDVQIDLSDACWFDKNEPDFCGFNLRGANLSRAFLSNASLESIVEYYYYDSNVDAFGEPIYETKTDLIETDLSNANLSEAHLDGANLGLVNLSKANLSGANLSGADLDRANLSEANLSKTHLSKANLSRANFSKANLSNTYLSEAKVLGADFTGANLTGACIENWNINSETKLDEVECDYVYLKESKQERRPSDPNRNFEPGEFTKLFQTVDLIFRNGVDWQALLISLEKLRVEAAGAELSIQEKHRYELKAKDVEIDSYKRENTNLMKMLERETQRPIIIQAIATATATATAESQAIAEAKSMNNSNDSSQTVNIRGNVTGSTINLGTISGNVANTINQLPESSTPDQPNLKQLLMQLKEEIEADPDLSNADKADLLEQVQNLAEAKQTEEPAQKEGLARKAKKMFEATLKSLPETAKIVEASSKLLPLILKALGFSA
jgi:uncharacterized protein YjbI with pentapeptide repeats